jgi:hypothetical protein
MGCGRKPTHRNNMYCEWCYDTWRRGGFDKVPVKTKVKAARDKKTGKIIRKASVRIQWKCPPDHRPPGYQSMAELRQQTDKRPRCSEEGGCPNLARHGGKCDKHNGRAAARIAKYRAEGKTKEWQQRHVAKVGTQQEHARAGLQMAVCVD